MIRIFLYLISFTALFAFVNSCSSEDEQTKPPTTIVKTPEAEPDPIKYNLTVNASEGGTVSTDGGTYDEGTSITIKATPNEGFEFVGWEGSDETDPEIVISVNSNILIKAIFNPDLAAAILIGVQDGTYVLTETSYWYEGYGDKSEWIINVKNNNGEPYYGVFKDAKVVKTSISNSYPYRKNFPDLIQNYWMGTIYNIDTVIMNEENGYYEEVEVSGFEEIVSSYNYTGVIFIDGERIENVKKHFYYKYNLIDYEPEHFITNQQAGKILREQGDFGYYADSIYRSIDPNDLNSIKNAFILDAKRNGLDISYLYDELLTIDIVDWNYGAAYGAPCISGRINLFWEDNYDILIHHYRGTLGTLWHELGHAALNLQHVCRNYNDIMYSKNPNFGGEINTNVNCDEISVDDDLKDNFPLEYFKENARRMFQNVGQLEYDCGFATQKNTTIVP